MSDNLQGRLALITGASGGIGSACARDLHALGVHLALTYSSSLPPLTSLISSLPASPPISTHHADMSHPSSLPALFAEIHAAHGRHPDILLCIAGHGRRTPLIDDITPEEWAHTIAVNLTAPFALTKLAVPHMRRQRWGRVVFMGSIAARGGGINGCHYAASKAGLAGMAANLATRHAAEGITFNDVAPAMIAHTGMVPDAASVAGTPGDVANIPVGRLGEPEEVAAVVTMLCRTGYITGQSILISGGLK